MTLVEPCPFCASVPRTMEGRGDWDRLDLRPRPNAHWVHCWSCGARSGEHRTQEEAVVAWNTRVSSDLIERYEPSEKNVERLAAAFYESNKPEGVWKYALEPWKREHRDRARKVLEALRTSTPQEPKP